MIVFYSVELNYVIQQFYCSKFSDKYSVLHQARNGNEKTLDGVYTSRRDNAKGEEIKPNRGLSLEGD